MVQIGRIKWFGGFNSKKGIENNYGFIEQLGKPDLYIHKSKVKCKYESLVTGQLVKFDLGDHGHRQEAKNLELLQLSEEFDPQVLKACFEQQTSKIWKPIVNRYLSTLSADEFSPTVIQKLDSLNPNQRLVFLESLASTFLFSPELRDVRNDLTTEQYLQLFLKKHTVDGNEQISQTLREEIIEVLDSARHNNSCIDRELLENIRLFIPEHPYFKKESRRNYINNLGIKYLYHMTHIENLNSILTKGLLSHNKAHQGEFIKKDISMQEAQSWRTAWHGYVPFYFNPRNTMLYKRQNIQNDVVMLGIDPMLILEEGTLFSDGNVAARATKIYDDLAMLEQLPWGTIKASSWNYPDPEMKQRCKRIMCAEVLVPEQVGVPSILKIFCRSRTKISEIQQIMPEDVKISVGVNPYLYF